LAPFFADDRHERFFVKNLERVQGDERDAIILTIGYGKDRSGKLSHNFGPVNRKGGERRLNVAITRARKRMTVVSSFSHHDVDPAKSRARGTELLRLYLEYAASGGKRLGDYGQQAFPENSFEADVQRALESRGIELIPQYGVSNYRIDFVAKHPKEPGRFVLAIECDGASYHSAYTARDRDRLRQQHLEALGWRFHRVWSTDWFMNRDKAIKEAVEAYRLAVIHSDRVDSPHAEALTVRNNLLRSSPFSSNNAATNVYRPNKSPRPPIPRKSNIDEYRPGELLQLIRWIESDGRLRTEQEIADELFDTLGFHRRGTRIDKAIRKAITQRNSQVQLPIK
jgi:very-short-patch-repair endonuclease